MILPKNYTSALANICIPGQVSRMQENKINNYIHMTNSL